MAKRKDFSGIRRHAKFENGRDNLIKANCQPFLTVFAFISYTKRCVTQFTGLEASWTKFGWSRLCVRGAAEGRHSPFRGSALRIAKRLQYKQNSRRADSRGG